MEKQDTRPPTLYACVACHAASGPADRMLNLALEGRKVEQVVLCRPCGQDARAFGHEVYHLQSTLEMIRRRQVEQVVREAARAQAAKEFFGKLGGGAQSGRGEEDSSATRQAAAKAHRAEKRDRRDSRSEEWETRRNGAAHGYLVTVG